MKARFAMAMGVAMMVATAASADTVIVDENFDGYADTAAFQAKWVPVIGNGSAAANVADVTAGILTSDPLSVPGSFPGVQGVAVDHIGATASAPGMVNQYGGIINQGAGQNPLLTALKPTATQSVFLSYDMFDGASGNERMSVGLRYTSVAGTTVTSENLIELGLYNSNSADPTVVGSTNPAQNAVDPSPGFYAGRQYGARVNIFGAAQAPLTHQPDWQYFRTTGETWGGQAVGDVGFDIGLERTTDTGDVVTIADIGKGWHRYTATVTPTKLTITIDLFRDGLRNTSKDPVTPGGEDRPGTPGVDAMMVYNIAPTANGFNNLRLGGPSGLQSAGTGATGFDNILLKLVDVVVPGGVGADFDNNGTVDGADFLIWQKNYDLTGQTSNANGDADHDGLVGDSDFTKWAQQFGGAPVPAAAAGAAVPEPASAALVGLALAGLAAARRRSR